VPTTVGTACVPGGGWLNRYADSCRHRGAEGFESRTQAQFIDVLGTAKASAGDVRSQLYVAHDQGYLDDEEFEAVSDRADKVSRQLYHLIRHLEQNHGSGRVQEIPEEYMTN